MNDEPSYFGALMTGVAIGAIGVLLWVGAFGVFNWIFQ